MAADNNQADITEVAAIDTTYQGKVESTIGTATITDKAAKAILTNIAVTDTESIIGWTTIIKQVSSEKTPKCLSSGTLFTAKATGYGTGVVADNSRSVRQDLNAMPKVAIVMAITEAEIGLMLGWTTIMPKAAVAMALEICDIAKLQMVSFMEVIRGGIIRQWKRD
ncbi:hypothetical protein G7Y89_g13445 [Cudoniella acicularis]|uniref:Uncharacterized protein n=1 Tax=Cudoniella acicularis TaxID=354080 RepID=A0A8H4R795_9HELO|nr:hypothetical protein G7Y89_g13445 [Cudoniella acicularis]